MAQFKHNSKKPLNNKIRRLGMMIEIRRLVVEGNNYEQIQQVLGLSRRTFYRYLQLVFREDKKVLEKENSDEVITQAAILKERFNKIYQNLQKIATDPKIDASDRIEASTVMGHLSVDIVKLYRDAPTLLAARKKNLLALREGGGYGVRPRLPPAINFLPERYNDYDSADTNNEEADDCNDSNVDTVNSTR